MEVTTNIPDTAGRLLWLTDTYGDHNGVSTVLKSIHGEIKARNLPVDIMVCSSTAEPDDHLIVIKPFSQFTLPLYREQPMRIPNYLSVQRAFRKGKYDRIICSTEGPMGLAALWLKNVFSVDAYFYLHTDWLSFAKEVLSLGHTGLDRVQKLMRIYYKRFGNIFVLNTDQQKWLTGITMGFDPARVFLTSHWVDGIFSAPLYPAKNMLPFDDQRPVVLYAGRISKEKGVMELPGIMQMARSVFPEIQIVIAGTGPAEEELKTLLPEALYLGWVGQEYLPALFRASDILLLPSRFDTFSCVVLEALTCGLPVVASNAGSLAEVIGDAAITVLPKDTVDIAQAIAAILTKPELRRELIFKGARQSQKFTWEKTITQLIRTYEQLVMCKTLKSG